MSTGESLPIKVGGDLAPKREVFAEVKDRFSHGPAWEHIKGIVKSNNIEAKRAQAASLVEPVKGTIAAILSQKGKEETDPWIEQAWSDIELRGAKGNAEPTRHFAMIKDLIEVWGQALRETGEAFAENNAPLENAVVIPGEKGAPAICYSAAYLERYFRQNLRLGKAKPTDTALALLDVAIQNLTVGEVLREKESQAQGKKEKKNRGHEVRRSEFGPIPMSEVKESDIKLWRTKQRQSSLVCLEAALDYRDIVYPGQNLTEQMVIEAMLMDIVPVDQRIIETAQYILGQHNPVTIIKQLIGQSTQKATANAVANLSIAANGLVEVVRSVIFGAGNADKYFKVDTHNGVQGIVGSAFHSVANFNHIKDAADAFATTSVTDFQSHLEEHLFVYGVLGTLILWLAGDASRRYSVKRTPVDYTSVSWAEQRADLLNDTLPVEKRVEEAEKAERKAEGFE